MPLTEEQKAYQRAYYLKNQERKKAFHRNNYAKNREHRKAQARAYRAENKEVVKAKDRARRPRQKPLLGPVERARRKAQRCRDYQAKHRERLLDEKRKKWALNKEENKERNRKWRETHRDYILQKARERYWANPERERANSAARRKSNPEIDRRHKHARRARKAGASKIDNIRIVKWERRWRGLESVRCYYCQGSFDPKDCATDHIVSLSKHGPHCSSNVCIACVPCNSRKGARTLLYVNKWISEPVLCL